MTLVTRRFARRRRCLFSHAKGYRSPLQSKPMGPPNPRGKAWPPPRPRLQHEVSNASACCRPHMLSSSLLGNSRHVHQSLLERDDINGRFLGVVDMSRLDHWRQGSVPLLFRFIKCTTAAIRNLRRAEPSYGLRRCASNLTPFPTATATTTTTTTNFACPTAWFVAPASSCVALLLLIIPKNDVAVPWESFTVCLELLLIRYMCAFLHHHQI